VLLFIPFPFRVSFQCFCLARNCAFVNFTNISNAIKAIDGIKNKPEYANLRIAHGKDRCANPPRSGPQGGTGAKRTPSGAGTSTGEATAVNGDGVDDGTEAFLNGDEGQVMEIPMHVDGVESTHQTNGVAS